MMVCGTIIMTDTVYTSEILYKRDSTGSVRMWQYEVGFDKTGYDILGPTGSYSTRTVSGLVDGKKVTSSWKKAEAKNIGKSNETRPEQQAYLESEADLNKRLERGYFRNIDDIDSFTKFKPMLARDYAKTKGIEFPVYSQPKLDGIRCIARQDGLWTRAGKEIVSCPHISESLVNFFKEFPDVILDGELYNHELSDNFNKITSLVRKTKPKDEDIEECAKSVQYHVYDVYDKNKLEANLITRTSEFLPRLDLLDQPNPIVRVNTYHVESQAELDDLYGEWLEMGYEGQMVRSVTGKYEPSKRSKGLLKRKEFFDTEFPVIRIEEGKGNWSGYIKRFVLQLPDGREFSSNVRGSQEVLKKLLESGDKPDWATCRYFTPTPDGIPRFPVVCDWGFGQRND